MAETIRLKQESKQGFFGRTRGLDGYLYKHVLDDYFFTQLRQHVRTYIDRADSRTYLIHGTTVNYENKQTKLISHQQNARDQNVIFDLNYWKIEASHNGYQKKYNSILFNSYIK